MHTKDYLAQQLRAAGLDAMADKAATGYYHDYLSPLDFPEMQLVNDLADAARATEDPARHIDIVKLRHRAMDGDFDASKEESDEWATSEEGRAAFKSLNRK